jgi:hypothetical protein
MATLLEICNDVLSDIGENPVTVASHPVAQKVFSAYKTSLRHVSSLYQWPHLLAERSAVITGDIGTFSNPTVQHVIDAVYIESPELRYRLASEERRDLWATSKVMPQGPTADLKPERWANFGMSQVRIYPAISSLYTDFLRFLVLNSPTIPTNLMDSSQVALPDDFLQAVKYHMEMIMHMRHTADMGSASAARSVFEEYVHMLRSRKSGPTTVDLRGAP